jgi:hypothetical protein
MSEGPTSSASILRAPSHPAWPDATRMIGPSTRSQRARASSLRSIQGLAKAAGGVAAGTSQSWVATRQSAGANIENLAPPSARFSAETHPPWRASSPWTMARPMPVPASCRDDWAPR